MRLYSNNPFNQSFNQSKKSEKMLNFKIKAQRGKSIHKFNLLAKNEEEAIKKAKKLTHYEFKIFIINQIKYLEM